MAYLPRVAANFCSYYCKTNWFVTSFSVILHCISSYPLTQKLHLQGKPRRQDQHLCQCLRNKPLVLNHKVHVRKHDLPEACVLERVHVRMLGLGREVDSDRLRSKCWRPWVRKTSQITTQESAWPGWTGWAPFGHHIARESWDSHLHTSQQLQSTCAGDHWSKHHSSL